MAELIQLQKGDIDNLEGRVIAYARISDQPNDKLVASYVCMNPLDFRDKFGEEEFVIMQSHIKRYLSTQSIEENDILNQNFPFYNTRLPISEQGIEDATEDVIHVGEFENEKQGLMAIIGATIVYTNRYLSQKESELSDEKGQSLIGFEVDGQKNKPYNNMIPEEKELHIKWNYLDPIMIGLNNSNQDQIMQTAREFVEFSRDSDIHDDVLRLAANLSKNPEEEITILYFQKIIAIATERYEDAARFRDKITEICQ